MKSGIREISLGWQHMKSSIREITLGWQHMKYSMREISLGWQHMKSCTREISPLTLRKTVTAMGGVVDTWQSYSPLQ